MRICATCGRLLEDGENMCPVCGESMQDAPAEDMAAPQTGELPAGTDGPAYVPVFETTYFDIQELRDALENSVPATEEEELSSAAEGGENALSCADTTEDAAVQPAEEVTAPRVETAAPPARQDGPLKAMRSGTGKLALILSIIALVGILVGIVGPTLRLSGGSDKEKAYMDYLCGSWISEPFMYADASCPSREIFTVNPDNTYRSVIVTSPTADDSYDAATWVETDVQEGTFIVDTSEAAIQVTFDLKGNKEVFLRYIRKLDSSSLTLREYYNDKKTDYFDVVFDRKD